MTTHSWQRRDMGGGGIIKVETPLTPSGKVAVEIPLTAYKRLVRWASIARTLDAIQSEFPEGDLTIAAEELEVLTPALIAIHEAVRNHSMQS